MTMHPTSVVVLYDPKLPYGREIVGTFDTKKEAMARADEFSGQNVKVVCRQATRYEPNLQDLHRVFDLTDFGGRERPSKVRNGLEFRSHGRLIAFWPADRPGTGTHGRVMPYDLRSWVIECLWAAVCNGRKMPEIFWCNSLPT